MIGNPNKNGIMITLPNLLHLRFFIVHRPLKGVVCQRWTLRRTELGNQTAPFSVL